MPHEFDQPVAVARRMRRNRPPRDNERDDSQEGRPVRDGSVAASADDGHNHSHDADNGYECGDPEDEAKHWRSLSQRFRCDRTSARRERGQRHVGAFDKDGGSVCDGGPPWGDRRCPRVPRPLRIPTAEEKEVGRFRPAVVLNNCATTPKQQVRHRRDEGTEHAMWNPLLLLVPALLGVVAWLLALLFEWVDRRAHDPRARMPRAKAMPATGAAPRHKRSSLGDRRSEGRSPRVTPP
jgi:hypothetical protein